MDVSNTTLAVIILIFTCIALYVCYQCHTNTKEEKNAVGVAKELAENEGSIDEIPNDKVEEALKNGKVYMLGYTGEAFGWNRRSFGYDTQRYPPILERGHPYGGDLYDWRPHTYYGGPWFKPVYPPILYKKRKMWKKGAWKKNNGSFYYITI